MALPKNHARQFISSPFGAIERLNYEILHWKSLEGMLDGANSDGCESNGLLKWLVNFHFRTPYRFGLTSVLMIDYSMPSLNGIDLIKRLGLWPGRKILLTGEADARVAIAAFNEGLIQKFIPKDTNQLYRVLKSSCSDLHAQVCEHIGHLLRPQLTTEQKELLQDEQVSEAISFKIKELDWDEYFVIGRPFGLIGMAGNGPLQWLQLETKKTLIEIAELAAELGSSPADIDLIKKGGVIPSHEIRVALSLAVRPVLMPAECILKGPDLYCAVYDLPLPYLSSEDLGMDDIMNPFDEIKSLLRDVVAQLNHSVIHADEASVSSGPTSDLVNIKNLSSLSHVSANGFSMPGLGYAIDRLSSVARQSDEYRQLLFIEVDKSRLPERLTAAIEDLLAREGITRI